MDMDFDTFLVGLYLMVDKWLQSEGQRYIRPQGGTPPRLTDGEMLTLLLAHAYTWSGLALRITAKLTAMIVVAWANLRHGLSPLSFVNFAW